MDIEEMLDDFEILVINNVKEKAIPYDKIIEAFSKLKKQNEELVHICESLLDCVPFRPSTTLIIRAENAIKKHKLGN